MNPITAVLAGLRGVVRMTRVRRILALTTAGVVLVATFAPVPANAQLSMAAVIAAANAVIRVINNTIRPLLDAAASWLAKITGLVNELRNLWENTVWPRTLIERAKGMVRQMISQFRALLWRLHRIGVRSARLPNPASLESVMRNRSTSDFSQLDQAYARTFREVPGPNDAHPIDRELVDIDDALARASLKAAKAGDALSDRMVQAAEQIEDEGTRMAPGSAPYLAGAGIIASIQGQAMMQKMLAAELRQEASRLAHENVIRKRSAMFADDLRRDAKGMFQR